MGEPSLFCVGGTQAKVRVDGVAVFAGGGVVGVGEGVAVGEEVGVGEEAGVGEGAGVVLVIVPEPLPFELLPAVSATVADAVEPTLVSLVAAAPVALPWPSSPQAASASARLPIKIAIAIRSFLIARSACLIPTPDRHSRTGQARGEVTNRGCTSGALWIQLALTHEAVRLAPATPLS